MVQCRPRRLRLRHYGTTSRDILCKMAGKREMEAREAQDFPHEAHYLKLDSTKLKTTFGWLPRWHIDEAVDRTVSWTKAWMAEESVSVLMDTQISDYLFSP